jgi:hypothetical protein
MSDRITVSEFIAKHPDIPSRVVRQWAYGASTNGLMAAGIVTYSKSDQFRVDDQAFLDWLIAHPTPPPRPPRRVGGLSVLALDGRPAPRLLPVLQEPVPAHGRPVSVFERHELSDWGVTMARSAFRVAPTATDGEFTLWKVSRRQVRRVPVMLTFAGCIGGTWTTALDLPTDQPRRRRKNPEA